MGFRHSIQRTSRSAQDLILTVNSKFDKIPTAALSASALATIREIQALAKTLGVEFTTTAKNAREASDELTKLIIDIDNYVSSLQEETPKILSTFESVSQKIDTLSTLLLQEMSEEIPRVVRHADRSLIAFYSFFEGTRNGASDFFSIAGTIFFFCMSILTPMALYNSFTDNSKHIEIDFNKFMVLLGFGYFFAIFIKTNLPYTINNLYNINTITDKVSSQETQIKSLQLALSETGKELEELVVQQKAIAVASNEKDQKIEKQLTQQQTDTLILKKEIQELSSIIQSMQTSFSQANSSFWKPVNNLIPKITSLGGKVTQLEGKINELDKRSRLLGFRGHF